MTASKVSRFITDVRLFTRFEYLPFAAILPFVGAGSASASVSGQHLIGLIAVAVSFHVYVSVLNDVADVRLDRKNPRRADYPLVRGAVLPSHALILVLVQIPIAIALTIWLRGSGWAYVALAFGMGLMTVYDLFGKRLPVPPVIDVIQGIGFGALVLYGAAIAGGPTRVTLVVFLLVVVWMVLTNLLGGLRDLSTDIQFGVSTTPIFLGARSRSGRHDIPGRIVFYAFTIQAILIGIELLAIVYNDFGYTPVTQISLFVVVAVLASIAVVLLAVLFRTAAAGRDVMIAVMVLQLASSALAILALLAPVVDLPLLSILAVVFLLSFGEYTPRPIVRYWNKRLLGS